MGFLAPARSVRLHWHRNTDADLSHYVVYKGGSADFPLSAGSSLGSTGDTVFVDGSYAVSSYYKVTAVDIHENESAWAELSPQQITSVDASAAPAIAYLKQNFPNPFNPRTAIEFGTPVSGLVSIRVFDAKGRLVRTLLHETRPAGVQWVTWDGNADGGTPVPSGVYVAKLEIGAVKRAVKMVLTR